jgi:hypothetical protein
MRSLTTSFISLSLLSGTVHAESIARVFVGGDGEAFAAALSDILGWAGYVVFFVCVEIAECSRIYQNPSNHAFPHHIIYLPIPAIRHSPRRKHRL